jgi:hypothetical protein
MTRCPSDLELERLLLGGARSPAAPHVRGCARCSARLVEMRREGEEFEREVFPSTVDAIVQRARPRRHAPGWLLAAAPLSAAAAAVLFLVARAPHDHVATKGAALTLAVFVQGPDGVRAAADGAAVPANAAVRFRVRAGHPCRLWIVSVDAAGQVSRLFPAGGDAPAELASTEALPGGAVLDGRGGPERMFAVCSAGALPLEDVERAARQAAQGGADAVRAARVLPRLPGTALQATLLLEKRP